MDAEPLFELVVRLHASERFEDDGEERHAKVDVGSSHLELVVDCAFRLAKEVELLNLAVPADVAFKEIDCVERNDRDGVCLVDVAVVEVRRAYDFVCAVLQYCSIALVRAYGPYGRRNEARVLLECLPRRHCEML